TEFPGMLAFHPAQSVGKLPGCIKACLWTLNRIAKFAQAIDSNRRWALCHCVVRNYSGESKTRQRSRVQRTDAVRLSAVHGKTRLVQYSRVECVRIPQGEVFVVGDPHRAKPGNSGGSSERKRVNGGLILNENHP